jgi:hypothetical protein
MLAFHPNSVFSISEKDLAAKYNTLLTPIGISYVTEEQLMLYNIALKVQRDKALRELFFYEKLNY